MYNEIGFISYKDTNKECQSLPGNRKYPDYDEPAFFVGLDSLFEGVFSVFRRSV